MRVDGFSDTHQITLIQLGVEQILEKKKPFPQLQKGKIDKKKQVLLQIVIYN